MLNMTPTLPRSNDSKFFSRFRKLVLLFYRRYEFSENFKYILPFHICGIFEVLTRNIPYPKNMHFGRVISLQKKYSAL